MHPAFVYLPGERLSLPELSAARLDGHVVDLGEAFIPADLVETAEARAASVRCLIPRDMAASGPTAAWIHGAGSGPPATHHARRAVQRRIRTAPSPRLHLHDAALSDDEFQMIADLAVTAPARTLADLAMALHRDPALVFWLRSLAEVHPDAVAPAEQEVRSRRRAPGIRLAVEAMSLISARRQEEVTR